MNRFKYNKYGVNKYMQNQYKEIRRAYFKFPEDFDEYDYDANGINYKDLFKDTKRVIQ